MNFGRLCVALGMDVSFIGKVGADPMGRLATELLEQDGIQAVLAKDALVATNMAVNFVNDAGQTSMPLLGNANQALHGDDVPRLQSHCGRR